MKLEASVDYIKIVTSFHKRDQEQKGRHFVGDISIWIFQKCSLIQIPLKLAHEGPIYN